LTACSSPDRSLIPLSSASRTLSVAISSTVMPSSDILSASRTAASRLASGNETSSLATAPAGTARSSIQAIRPHVRIRPDTARLSFHVSREPVLFIYITHTEPFWHTPGGGLGGYRKQGCRSWRPELVSAQEHLSCDPAACIPPGSLTPGEAHLFPHAHIKVSCGTLGAEQYGPGHQVRIWRSDRSLSPAAPIILARAVAV
jgi:hypothetical protein